MARFTFFKKNIAAGIVLLLWLTLSPELRQNVQSILFHQTAESHSDSASEQPALKEDEGVVERVVDGDTFVLEGGEKVRLIGIDAPESVKPGTKPECFGKESSTELKTQIEGKTVRLERDKSERDRYGRLLRYVYVEGAFLNAQLAEGGYARAVAYPPDTKRFNLIQEAEFRAKQSQLGLWDPAFCPAP